MATADKIKPLSKDEAEAMSIQELEAHLDAGREYFPRPYLQQVMAVRNAKIVQEQLDHHQLTAEQYIAAKTESVEKELPLGECINRARVRAFRQAREIQTAKAGTAAVGVKATRPK